MTTDKIHTIDAAGRPLGRVASEVAHLLRGKGSPSFERHLLPAVKVTVVNVSKLSITGRKLVGKTYRRYSGYPGGLKFVTLGQLITKKGHREAVKLAVRGMLPANKLRPKIMKNLSLID
jgi:small subunit ribosomal protein S9